MDELIIEKACELDFDEISKVINEIIVELFPHFYALDRKISIQKTDDRIKEEIKAGKLFKIITKSKDELIGSVTIVDGEIESMYLVPFYQKRGYGRHVLSLIEFEKEQLCN